MKGGRLGILSLALLLGACASVPHARIAHRKSPHPVHKSEQPSPRPAPSPFPAVPTPSPALETGPARAEVKPGVLKSFANLPGWSAEDHLEAFMAYKTTCRVSRAPAAQALCRQAATLAPATSDEARQFFEQNFIPEALPGEGVLTGYFVPEYEARSAPDKEFSAPVRPRPSDLPATSASQFSYDDRSHIERRSAKDALAWMRPEDLFFMQIQGSGQLTFPDGSAMKALYAGANGQTFVAISKPMREKGLLDTNHTSGDAIRAWLSDHRGAEADQVMALNPRYVFFRLAPDDGLPPLGAAGLPLPAGRAIAVDPAQHTYGDLYWVEAAEPFLFGAHPVYERLVTALDTGGAIKGQIRADLYIGQGPDAGQEAGRIRHTLHLYRLIPRS